MNEMAYMKALAVEVRRHTDPRLKILLEWCEKQNIAIGSCAGDAFDQKNQAAVIASALLMEVHYVEATSLQVPPHISHTPFTREDPKHLHYTVEPDFDAKEICIKASVVDTQGNEVGGWSFEPVKFAIRAFHETSPQAKRSGVPQGPSPG